MLRTLANLQTYFTREDRREWLVLLVASLAAGLAQSLTLAIFNEAVAAYAQGRPNELYVPIALGLMAVAVASRYFGAVRGHVVSSRMAIRLRNALLERLAAANLRVLERIGSSGLHYHLMTTINNLSAAYGTLLGFVTSFMILACNFVYIGWLSPAGLVAALLVTLVGLTVHFRQERLNLAGKQRLDWLGNVISARHREALDGYKELRLASAKRTDYGARIDEVNREFSTQGLAVTKISTAGDLATNFFQFFLILILVFMLPRLVALDAVVIMQLMAAILVTIAPLSGAVGAFPGFTRARIALENLRMLQEEMDATRELPEDPAGRRLPEFQSIELRGVEFSFGGEGFRLGPLDLTVRRGDVVFLVGGNGSGKTVLLRVLTALYHETAGGILYNGRPLAAQERQAYREQFAAVFSDFYLFRELLGHRGAGPQAVHAWLQRLDLADKTRFAEDEFSTVELSAGQRKRLAFAVAMLDNRPIVVLDEFGAEQDPEHRRSFYRDLIPLLRKQGKTVIVVTHDDTYFDAGDRVLKMDFGRIVSEQPAARGRMLLAREG